MVIVVGVVIALVVVLSGNEGGTAEPIVTPSTEGPTTVITIPTEPTTTSPPTAAPTTTEDPVVEPPAPDEPIALEDIINGVFAPSSFNGTWTTGNQIV